ncbi:hypothetical protein WAI453_009360 [Rhynchosporium graminicola]
MVTSKEQALGRIFTEGVSATPHKTQISSSLSSRDEIFLSFIYSCLRVFSFSVLSIDNLCPHLYMNLWLSGLDLRLIQPTGMKRIKQISIISVHHCITCLSYAV